MSISVSQTLTLSAILLLSAGQLRADNIDAALAQNGPLLKEYLEKNRFKNVGVLKFRTKKGNEDFTFLGGSMNVNMVRRLENMLILIGGEKKSINLLNEPGQVIAKTKAKLNYLSPQGRSELFDIMYPSLGSKQSVRADVFLCGDVITSPDFRTTTVIVRAINSAAAKEKPVKLMEVAVTTDRSMLADLGKSFAVARNIKKGGDRDDPINIKFTLEEMKKVLQFSVSYDKVEQDIAVDSSGEIENLKEPTDTQTVSMKIKNLSSKQIGVVLKVNGVSTLFEQDGEFLDCKKYVLDPNEEYTIQGFLCEDSTIKPFKVLPDGMSPDSMDPAKMLGQIQLGVFETGAAETVKVSNRSLRGVLTPKLLKAREQNPLKSVGQITKLKATARGYIEPNGEAPLPAVKVTFVDFEGTLAFSRTITYVAPKITSNP